MKKLLIASALSLPLVFTNVKSYEFPEKLPYGDISANIGYYSHGSNDQYHLKLRFETAQKHALLSRDYFDFKNFIPTLSSNK